jgi:hypothetical protein
MENLEVRLVRLEHWRDGNGARGAEERLQEVEQAVRQAELRHQGEDIGIKQMVAEQLAALRSEILALVQRRDRAAVERLKAFAPYVAMAVGIICPLVK